MTADRSFGARFRQLYHRVTQGSGELSPVVRLAAASGGPVPTPTQVYTDKVRRHAYKVVDRDVEDLLAAGWSEDEIYELTVAIAMGQSMSRFERAQLILDEARR